MKKEKLTLTRNSKCAHRVGRVKCFDGVTLQMFTLKARNRKQSSIQCNQEAHSCVRVPVLCPRDVCCHIGCKMVG